MIDKKIEELKKEIADLELRIREWNPTNLAKGSHDWERLRLIGQKRTLNRELTYLIKVGNPIYKIRNTETGEYSQGLLRGRTAEGKTNVYWSKKGKAWTSEALLKKHLMKCIVEGSGIPDDWEVVKLIEEPVKEMHDWIDSEMLVELLKHNKKEE